MVLLFAHNMRRLGTGYTVNRLTVIGHNDHVLVDRGSVVMIANRKETCETVFFDIIDDKANFVHVRGENEFAVSVLAVFHKNLALKLIYFIDHRFVIQPFHFFTKDSGYCAFITGNTVSIVQIF